MTQSTHNAPEATVLMVRPPAGIWCSAYRLAVAPGSSEGDVTGPDQV